MNETESLLQQAIQARIKGYNIIPLRGGEIGNDNYKRPAVAWDKYQNDLSTITEIRSWYEENPSLQFGIVTGPISKLFVVDLDNAEAEKWFFERESGVTLASSACVKTRKGWHIYFRWTDELNEKVTTKVRISEGVDIRGEGGYVVAWNLRNLGDISKLPPVPAWLRDLLPSREGKRSLEAKRSLTVNRDWLAEAFASLKIGDRNDTFTRIAGSLRSRGYSANAIFEFLKGKAQEVGFPLSELGIICNSVSRYEPRANGSVGESNKFSEFVAKQERVEWISEEIIAKESIIFMAGLPGTSKTWATMDLALECAREHGLWLGKFPVKQCKVLYIEQERSPKETRRRLKALAAAKDIPPKVLDENLMIKCGTSIRIDLMSSYNAFHRELADFRPDLVIVDSFKTFTTKDITSNVDMQAVMEQVKALRAEFGCTFIFVYHENKMAYQRGEDEKKKEVTAEYLAGAAVLSEVPEIIFIVEGRGSKESMFYQVKNNLGEIIAPFATSITNETLDRSKIVVKVI